MSEVVALDLGSARATAVLARLGEEGVEVLHVADVPSRGVRRGVVTDLEAGAHSADAALRKIADAAGREIASVIVAVSGVHVEGTNGQGLKTISPGGRTITNQDVLEVVNNSRTVMFPPDREGFQALPREFRVDGQRGILRPVGMSGGRLEVTTYLVSGQIAHLKNLERAVSLNGRRVQETVLAPLAAGIAVLTQEELEAGAAVVDVGAGKTDLAVFVGGSLAYSATVPLGSGSVTGDLSNLLKTGPEEAERLKIEHAEATAKDVDPRDVVEVQQLGQPVRRPMQRVVLCEIVESRVREIARMVAQHIEKSGFGPMLPSGIALTGGGSRMRGLGDVFSEACRMRVRCAAPDLGARESRPELAVAVGLAQFALDEADDLTPLTHGGFYQRVRSLISLIRRD